MTIPIKIKHITQATTINARELVGLMNNSNCQFETSGSSDIMMSYEFGMIGVQILTDLSAPIENAALKLSI